MQCRVPRKKTVTKSVTVTITAKTGAGGNASDRNFVVIDGVTYKSSTTLELKVGTEVTAQVTAASTSYATKAVITLNDITVAEAKKVTLSATYTFAVTDNCSIVLAGTDRNNNYGIVNITMPYTD